MAGQLKNQIVLITGSTDGLGRHTAERIARAGAAHLIIHGRNPARTREVEQSLTKAGASVSSIVADLSSFDEVRRLADEAKHTLQTKGKPLNCLFNNAGVFEDRLQKSKDGYEMTWAVNVAAPYLLTSLLLDSITDRIVNVASISAASSIDFGNLQQERGYSSHNAYSLSKLCNIMFSMELAERLAAAGKSLPTSNALDPGTVNTKMLFQGWGPIGIPVSSANDQFWLGTEPLLAEATGRYYVSRRDCRPPSPASDPAARKKLWDLLQEQTGALWNI